MFLIILIYENHKFMLNTYINPIGPTFTYVYKSILVVIVS